MPVSLNPAAMTRARVALVLVATTAGLIGWAMTWAVAPVLVPPLRVTAATVCTVSPQMRVRPVGLVDEP